MMDERMEQARARIESNKLKRQVTRMNLRLTRGSKEKIKQAIDALPAEDRFNKIAITAKIAEQLFDLHCKDGSEENQGLEYQSTRQGFRTSLDIMDSVELYLTKYASEN